MLKEDLIAERIAIESYREMARFFGTQDPTTRRMLEEILAKEEEHADDLTDLLYAQSEHGEPRNCTPRTKCRATSTKEKARSTAALRAF